MFIFKRTKMEIKLYFMCPLLGGRENRKERKFRQKTLDENDFFPYLVVKENQRKEVVNQKIFPPKLDGKVVESLHIELKNKIY